MHRIDGPGATVDNKFTEGDPITAVPATEVTDDWLNSVQEEIAAVIESAGLTLSKVNNAQLLAAITAKITAAIPSAPADASETVKGIIELATVSEVQAGTDAVRAITPATLSARTATETRAGLIEAATTAETSDGTDNSRAVTPLGLYPLVRPTTITNLNSHSFGDFVADAAATGSPDPAAGALWGRTFSNPALSSLKFQLLGASATNKVYARFYNGTTFGTAKEIATSISPLAARAWVKFNGTGTLNVNKSYNVSSVTDNGVGVYTINFTTPMDDTSYAYAGMAASLSAGATSATCVDQHPTTAPTASALPIMVKASSGGGPIDAPGICVVVFD